MFLIAALITAFAAPGATRYATIGLAKVANATNRTLDAGQNRASSA